MYVINNEEISSDLSLHTLCEFITSRLNELKQYFKYLLKYENKIILEQYKHYCDPLLDSLYMFEFFDKECLALFSASEIIQYILEHKKLTPELKNFIKQVWMTFAKLMKFKLYMIENNTTDLEKEYDKIYSQYSKEYSNQRHYFYINIYQSELGNEDFEKEFCRIFFE